MSKAPLSNLPRNIYRFCLLLLAAMSLSCYSSYLDNPSLLTLESESLSDKSSILFSVLGEDHQPLGGAEIVLINANKCMQKAIITDIRGNASLDAIDPGENYCLIVTAIGYHNMVETKLSLAPHRSVKVKVVMSEDSSRIP